ncbi:MAG: ATP-dependent RNA helicase [Azospira oryzae]|jgi:ATP-dependent RNA helicase DeaD|nr:ATP-dependent RNA helicase [Cytophaga sp.]PZR38947.1 MAG: ATP-dependent RNA helicase [Azospira oryzae]
MKSFADLGLSKGLVESVQLLGFESPTPIQEQAIPVLLTGNRDFVGLAQTGTGKTAAFGLPLLDLVDDKSNDTQALVLAPTRELGLQIANDLENFSEKIKRFNIVAVYGGASISEQIRKVKRGAQIIVATPGRLIDLIDRKAINLSSIKYVVLDEADEMLNMGFKDDLDKILSFTSKEKATWLFSATMPREVRSIMKNYMTDPFELQVGEQNTGNVNIEHAYVVIQDRDKYLALKRILDYTPDIFGLIFCRTRIDTQKVAEMLMKDGYNADSLHGDLTQQQRDRVMVRFRQRDLQILVATDVAARGIDVDDITHVIHLNIPDEMEFYTHRSGRTARAGKKGISIAMISKRELGKVKQIEKTLKSTFRRMMVPTGPEVCQKQLLSLMHKVHEVKVNESEIEAFLPQVYEALKGLTKEELIKRFASIEFNRFLDYYRNAPDLNTEGGKRMDGEGGDRYAAAGGTRFFINLGRMDGIEKAQMLELLDDFCGLEKKDIGKIDLKGAYSFFEVEKEKAEQVLKGFKGGVEYQGRQVRVEETSDSGGGGRRSRGGDRDDSSSPRRSDGPPRRERSGSGGGSYSDRRRSDKPSYGGSRSERGGSSSGRSYADKSSKPTSSSSAPYSEKKHDRTNKKWDF